MPAIIYQLDKRSGITYAYESVSHWDKEKKQSRCKRTLIGRVNAETRKIVPTRKKQAILYSKTKQESGSTMITSRYFFGATYLFDKIGKDISSQRSSELFASITEE
jgi:hypothetical protein